MDNADIRWFKQQFGASIIGAIMTRNLPFSVDMIATIACQETGYIWSTLSRKGLPVERILTLCVGDTLDTPNRKAFPVNKEALLMAPRGPEMFAIARQALVDMASHITSYKGAASNPNKFCHGYGIFQYDLQFFKTDPNYFLERRYEKFDQTLGKCLDELANKMTKLGLKNRTLLTDAEFYKVAIAYNTGGYVASRGLKQGHKDDSGVYYGEHIEKYLKQCKAVQVPLEPLPLPPEPVPLTPEEPVTVPRPPSLPPPTPLPRPPMPQPVPATPPGIIAIIIAAVIAVGGGLLAWFNR